MLMTLPRMPSWRRFLKGITLFVLVGLILVSAITIRTYRSFPVMGKDQLLQLGNTGLTLLDRHNQEFFRFDAAGRRIIVPYESLPPHLTQALVAAEDKYFFEHPGISPIHIAQAAWRDLKARRLIYGGSTITQQLAKN